MYAVHSQGDVEAAKALYREALTLNANLGEAHINMGNLLPSSQAVRHFRAAAEGIS